MRVRVRVCDGDVEGQGEWLAEELVGTQPEVW